MANLQHHARTGEWMQIFLQVSPVVRSVAIAVALSLGRNRLERESEGEARLVLPEVNWEKCRAGFARRHEEKGRCQEELNGQDGKCEAGWQSMHKHSLRPGGHVDEVGGLPLLQRILRSGRSRPRPLASVRRRWPRVPVWSAPTALGAVVGGVADTFAHFDGQVVDIQIGQRREAHPK